MSMAMSEKNINEISHQTLIKLRAVYDALKTAEKKAADFLLREPVFFAKSAVTDAADKAGCSEATLVRLAKKLGYEGYPELKAALLSDGKDDSPSGLYDDISVLDDDTDVIRKVFHASIQALHDTLGVLDKKEYQKAVEAICAAKKIIFCGAGDAYTVAQSGYHKFIRIGLNVQISADLDVQLITASHLQKGDVIIAISHFGKTKSIVDTVKYGRSVGATIISITNFPISPLQKNSDILLLTAAFTNHLKGEVMSKRIAELCILESLFINVLLKRKEELSENLYKSNVALEVNKFK